VSSGADLFVVCKQCGAEVSPYITECPYCGNRLRRRAPKLPRVNAPAPSRSRRQGLGSLLGGARGATKASPRRRPARSRASSDRWAVSRPYATIAIVTTACVGFIAVQAVPFMYEHMILIGGIRTEWWRLITSQFVYFRGGGAGVYAFLAIGAAGLFGWLLERRHGPAVVLALYLGAGVAGGLVATATYTFPVVTGGNAAALALLMAWAAPDILDARASRAYDGDLAGAMVIAALLLAVPFARPEASWLGGVTGAAIGLVVGLGLGRVGDARA
jgi:membrane associated rhomboid family serine protease/DNA-directed RNA polymerase subunit RPC12/RpoP